MSNFYSTPVTLTRRNNVVDNMDIEQLPEAILNASFRGVALSH